MHGGAAGPGPHARLSECERSNVGAAQDSAARLDGKLVQSAGRGTDRVSETEVRRNSNQHRASKLSQLTTWRERLSIVKGRALSSAEGGSGVAAQLLRRLGLGRGAGTFDPGDENQHAAGGHGGQSSDYDSDSSLDDDARSGTTAWTEAGGSHHGSTVSSGVAGDDKATDLASESHQAAGPGQHAGPDGGKVLYKTQGRGAVD